MQQHGVAVRAYNTMSYRYSSVFIHKGAYSPHCHVSSRMESDEGKSAEVTEKETQTRCVNRIKTEEESGMSFASRALYFPNGSSPFPGQKGWPKRESQPRSIVAAGSSIFHPHRALVDSRPRSNVENGLSIGSSILFFRFMYILREVDYQG